MQRANARSLAYQQAVGELEWLNVDLWPDYDRASVLVLLTGSLPAEASLPAQLTLPLPADATLNAVARISDAGEMVDDIDFEDNDGALTLTTPDRRFRVEYYAPYAGSGLQREFTFRWPGGPAVMRLDVSVQQPLAATTVTVQPEAEASATENDGMRYHYLPARALQAGEPFTVAVSYTLAREQLTVEGMTTAPPAEGGAHTTNLPSLTNWPMLLAIGGVVLLLVAAAWHFYSRRAAQSRAPRKPRPTRAAGKGARAQFCHACGAKAQAGDRFCRACGTQLKQLSS